MTEETPNGSPTEPLPAEPAAAAPTNAAEDSLSPRERMALWALRRLGADPDTPSDLPKGRFPTTRQWFFWDLAPHKVAPARDGVVLPPWKAPRWLRELAPGEVEAVLAAQIRETQLRQAGVAQTEQKASRLLTPFVALLTGAVALVAFQLSFVHDHDGVSAWLALAGAFLGGLGSACLLVGLTRALDADTRMGLAITSTANDELLNPMKALVNEVYGSQAARFIQRNKAERILYARAAISRSWPFLVVSALFGAASLLTASSASPTDADEPVLIQPTVTVTITIAPMPSPGPTTPTPSRTTSAPRTSAPPAPRTPTPSAAPHSATG